MFLAKIETKKMVLDYHLKKYFSMYKKYRAEKGQKQIKILCSWKCCALVGIISKNLNL